MVSPKIEKIRYDALVSVVPLPPFQPHWVWQCPAQMKGEDRKVVAVIGDGAMTGGLAFEGAQQYVDG